MTAMAIWAVLECGTFPTAATGVLKAVLFLGESLSPLSPHLPRICFLVLASSYLAFRISRLEQQVCSLAREGPLPGHRCDPLSSLLGLWAEGGQAACLIALGSVLSRFGGSQ